MGKEQLNRRAVNNDASQMDEPYRGLRVVLAYLLQALQVLHPTLLPLQRAQEGHHRIGTKW